MDLQFRRKLSLVAAQISAIEAVELGVMAAMASGRNPGPASSLLKIQGTETQQRIQELAIEVAGHYAAPDQHEARQPGSGLAADRRFGDDCSAPLFQWPGGLDLWRVQRNPAGNHRAASARLVKVRICLIFRQRFSICSPAGQDLRDPFTESLFLLRNPVWHAY